jgi:hypothetical protein
MEFVEQVRAFAASIKPKLDNATNEYATDHFLIMPFISQVLGFNPFNPDEVIPQYDANVGASTNYKLDYALLQDGKPIILIECKCYGTDFSKGKDSKEWSQLFSYYIAVDARIGILTDGVVYKFYADLEKPNKMDSTPFLEIDLLNLNEAAVKELAKLTKASFDADRVIETASELKYVGGIKSLLKQQLHEPSDDFTKFFFRELCSGSNFVGQLKEDFLGYTQRAMKEFIREEIDSLLDVATGKTQPNSGEKGTESEENSDPSELSDNPKKTEFTEDEREGFYILKSILRQTVDPGRITYKDTQGHCNVLLDGNGWRQIVRFLFNNPKNKRLELYSMDEDGNKTTEKVQIEDLNDIYKYSDRFKSIVIAYEAKAASS